MLDYAVRAEICRVARRNLFQLASSKMFECTHVVNLHLSIGTAQNIVNNNHNITIQNNNKKDIVQFKGHRYNETSKIFATYL